MQSAYLPPLTANPYILENGIIGVRHFFNGVFALSHWSDSFKTQPLNSRAQPAPYSSFGAAAT